MDVERATSGWDALGALIRDARKRLGLSQTTVVELLTLDLEERGHPRVHQSLVSANEGGERWRDRPELVGAYTRVLRLDENEVRAALYGLPDGQPTMPPTFEAVVRSDPSLDDEAKAHIIKQYSLLRAATLHNRLHRKSSGLVSDEEMALIDQALGRGDDDPPRVGRSETA